jgi:hypothetical protein
MFSVGDLVKVVDTAIDREGVDGLLVVNEVLETNHWTGSPILEVRNSDGVFYGISANALVAV